MLSLILASAILYQIFPWSDLFSNATYINVSINQTVPNEDYSMNEDLIVLEFEFFLSIIFEKASNSDLNIKAVIAANLSAWNGPLSQDALNTDQCICAQKQLIETCQNDLETCPVDSVHSVFVNLFNSTYVSYAKPYSSLWTNNLMTTIFLRVNSVFSNHFNCLMSTVTINMKFDGKPSKIEPEEFQNDLAVMLDAMCSWYRLSVKSVSIIDNKDLSEFLLN